MNLDGEVNRDGSVAVYSRVYLTENAMWGIPVRTRRAAFSSGRDF